MSEPILKVDKLTTKFTLPGGLWKKSVKLTAIQNISFNLYQGEILGIVGESGCGKSTLGRSILQLVHPTSGHIVWQGRDITGSSAEDMRRIRQDMQIIFQDPIASLNPRMSVGEIIGEPLTVFEPELSRNQRLEKVLNTMDAVGLAPDMINRFPHEFSGGQAQRIGIARALVSRPKLIICDEPVSALDVSIQAQIINLLKELQHQFNLTIIFISHDLSVIRLICDRILVLYLGRIVEAGPKADIFEKPAHPYTRALLSAAPIPDPKKARQRQRIVLQGDPPSPLNPPKGCVFSSRCPMVKPPCQESEPDLIKIHRYHEARCILLKSNHIESEKL